jgi:hypothetical protein
MRALRLLQGLLVGCVVAAWSACGGGGMKSPPPAPVFTTTPSAVATEDVLYSYSVGATDPAGGTVSFALTTAPGASTLSGSMLAWTPAAAQSRIPNSFTITATTSSGGTATQSWTVTPAGTITVNWMNTSWSSAGAAQLPGPSGAAVLAVVPQPDGSLASMPGMLVSPGLFHIPNVPAGYYWLIIQEPPTVVPPTGYWTSSSTFDNGTDFAGVPLPLTTTPTTTTFDFTIDGLEATPTSSWLGLETDTALAVPFYLSVPGGSTTATGSVTTSGIGNNVDWSRINAGFFGQLKPASLGSFNFLTLGPELTVTSLSLASGTTNSIQGTLQPSPQATVDLEVLGSKWGTAFENVGPTPAKLQSSRFAIAAETYVTGRNAAPSINGPDIFLVAPASTNPAEPYAPGGCVDLPFLSPFGMPGISSDEDFGTIGYGDPFPPEWTRAMSFCQGATVGETLGTLPFPLALQIVNGETLAPASTPLAPIALPVQNPTVNGMNLFAAGTVNNAAVTLAWSAASTGTTPYGYTVQVIQVKQTSSQAVELLSKGAYSTAKTSLTLPPQAAGQDYLFLITTQVDASANMETSPHRSNLPTGFASILSAPITITSGAITPAIRGNAKAFEELDRHHKAIPIPGLSIAR